MTVVCDRNAVVHKREASPLRSHLGLTFSFAYLLDECAYGSRPDRGEAGLVLGELMHQRAVRGNTHSSGGWPVRSSESDPQVLTVALDEALTRTPSNYLQVRRCSIEEVCECKRMKVVGHQVNQSVHFAVR